MAVLQAFCIVKMELEEEIAYRKKHRKLFGNGYTFFY